MCYCFKIEPVASYAINRRCAGCGCKTRFVSTGNFRVNANGNRIDVWLIYQCCECRHSYNLTIKERVKTSSIEKGEYERFLCNDEELALLYGTDRSVFTKNAAEIIDEDIYVVSYLGEKDENAEISVYNPAGLKVRADKLIADIYRQYPEYWRYDYPVSRNRVKDIPHIIF